jgi:hypothetical protein
MLVRFPEQRFANAPLFLRMLGELGWSPDFSFP